jgi:hypothetical protein
MSLELRVDADALRPIIKDIVAEVVAILEADRSRLGDRLAFSEAEAAALLGLHVHQLRDLRLEGKVAASKIVGGRIAYQRSDLLRYLAERRVEADGNGLAWRQSRTG